MVREHRNFRRYAKRYPAEISLRSKAHRVEVVDYSLNGVGVIVKDSLQITKGDILRIESDQLSLYGNCKVEWWSSTPHGIRVGLHKIEPLTGSLEHFRLPDVFTGLQRSLKTGIFSITSGPVEKKIYIKSGDMIFASSNQSGDRLGDVLLREGRITQEEFDRSSELIRQTGKRQGAILIELGAVKPKDLFWAVKHQVTEIILSFFTLTEGTFTFHEGDLPSDEVITLKLSAGNLIYRGIKRPDCIDQIKDYLTLPPETVFAFSQNPLDLFQDVSFDEEDRKILSLVDAKRTLRDIVSLSGLDEATTRRSLAALLSTSIIDVALKDAAPPEEDVVMEAIILEEEGHPETMIKEETLSEASTSPEMIEKIEALHHGYQNMDYYTLLGIEEAATESKIRWAFYKVAKEFHPDRHFYLNEDMKGKLHDIFSQITAAYNVLSSPEKRKKYDASASTREHGASRTDQARRKFEEGLAELHRKNFLDASQLFAEALYLDDTVAQYHYYYGMVLAELSRLKDAARVMTRASDLAPDNDDIIAELGLIYAGLGFPLRAKRHFEKALELNPANAKAREWLQTHAA